MSDGTSTSRWTFTFGGRPRDFTGSLTSIESRGTTGLKYPTLAANVGGPLAVQASQSRHSAETEWQLLEPHVAARVQATASGLKQLGTGQTAIVELTIRRGTVGQVITQRLASLRSAHETSNR